MKQFDTRNPDNLRHVISILVRHNGLSPGFRLALIDVTKDLLSWALIGTPKKTRKKKK